MAYRLLNKSLALFLISLCLTAQASPPFADAHMHYNWNQRESLPPEEAVKRLREQNVVMAVVASSPQQNSLDLYAAAPDIIVPIFSPYLDATYRHTWAGRPEVLDEARKGLEKGLFHGIGEVHLVPGLGPGRNNKILRGLLQLAREYDVPFLVHTDASSYKYLLPVCREFSKVQFVFAHAGGILPPEQVSLLMAECSNLVIDLTARDPWRYIKTPITDNAGSLLPGWRDVVMKYPDRVLTGSDAVWPVEAMHNWFEEDTGWFRLGEFLDFHRRWLADLPEDVQKKIRLENAFRIYRKRSYSG